MTHFAGEASQMCKLPLRLEVRGCCILSPPARTNTELLSNIEFNEPLQTKRTLRLEEQRVIRLNATWYNTSTLRRQALFVSLIYYSNRKEAIAQTPLDITR